MSCSPEPPAPRCNAPAWPGYLGLAVVIGFITASMTSEVFNLIYTASFYGLLVAALAAAALAKEAQAPGAAR